jgi:PKD repeat protein
MWEIAANGGPIVPSAPPSPAFHFDPPSPRPGQTVSFTDESTGGASSWSWSFGDGTTSSAQSPTHVYAAPGTYTARLSASNAAGTASTTRSVPVSFGSTGTGAAFTYLLPVIVTTSGENGTVFTTETSFTNRSGRVLTLTFRAKGSTFESSSTYALAAGQEIHGDVVAFLRTTGMSLPAGSVVASLRIEVVGADDLSQFGALARVTTPPNASLLSQGIRGRFGLAFPAMPLGRAASSEAIVYGLQDTSEPGSAGTRSNLACVSAGGNGTLQLEATYHDGDTGQDAPGPDVFTLSPFQFDQRNRPLKARGITHGYVRIRRVSGNDQFVCYAVLNDNLNGDGAFVPMVANDAASPTSSAILPVIVDTAGFRSEMTVANRTQRSIAALFAVIRADDPVPDWGYYNFDPGEQTTIADIAQDLRDAGFDLPSGSVASVYLEFLDGTLHDDQSDTQTPIPTSEGYVGVRTYQERAGGLFGLAYGYAPLGSSADTVAFVYGLQQTGAKGSSAGTRSNLAVVHALGGNVEPLTLEVTYYGPNGAELGKEPPLTLQPGEWHQFNAPLAPFGVPHGFARIRRLSGSDQFLAYGVLNDQLNDDGSYVPMVTP